MLRLTGDVDSDALRTALAKPTVVLRTLGAITLSPISIDDDDEDADALGGVGTTASLVVKHMIIAIIQ